MTDNDGHICADQAVDEQGRDVHVVHKGASLEKPERLAELDCEGTLSFLGLTGDMAFADAGAGTGVFSEVAAHMTTGPVYAIDINPELLEIIDAKREAGNLDNLVTMLCDETTLPLGDGSADVALVCTVLHELADPSVMIAELHRILAEGGVIGVIEFQGHETPLGPPLKDRLSEQTIDTLLAEGGFTRGERRILGDNLYVVKATAL